MAAVCLDCKNILTRVQECSPNASEGLISISAIDVVFIPDVMIIDVQVVFLPGCDHNLCGNKNLSVFGSVNTLEGTSGTGVSFIIGPNPVGLLKVVSKNICSEKGQVYEDNS